MTFRDTVRASASGKPAAEIDPDAELVRTLLREQHPDLAALELERAESGWDNVMWRLGDHLAVRLPRRAAGAALVESEQRWLPEIASRLPLPIPAPLRVGRPAAGYPWYWSIVPWYPGEASDLQPPDPGELTTLARFLACLHVPPPGDAPHNPARSVPLAARRDAVEARMASLVAAGEPVAASLRSLWEDAVAAAIDVAPTWIHGDLHPRNVLVHEGAISAVVDWGDMAAGDRATDLASLWMLSADASGRAAAIASYTGASRATWLRARGWALFFAVMLLDNGRVDEPRHAAIGRRTLQQLIAGP
jgi:aminoglycoside phosphotransferase (APT) family kinase protein